MKWNNNVEDYINVLTVISMHLYQGSDLQAKYSPSLLTKHKINFGRACKPIMKIYHYVAPTSLKMYHKTRLGEEMAKGSSPGYLNYIMSQYLVK